jgi:hypothetical protein
MRLAACPQLAANLNHPPCGEMVCIRGHQTMCFRCTYQRIAMTPFVDSGRVAL